MSEDTNFQITPPIVDYLILCQFQLAPVFGSLLTSDDRTAMLSWIELWKHINLEHRHARNMSSDVDKNKNIILTISSYVPRNARVKDEGR